MAFFKFRKNGAEQSGPTPAPESLEVLRKRARHRLIGAAALVLLGVVGFPMLFDSQPRPVAVDIAIDIPDKAKVAPLSAAPASAAPAPDAPPAVEPTPHASSAVPPVAAKVAPVTPPAASAPAAAKVEPKVEPKPEAKAEPKAESKPETKTTPKADSKADTKASAKPDEKTATSGKAQALLDGKDPADAAAAAPRYTVQVGAFADAKKVQEVRATLEKAGIKTYTQVVTTAEGKRTRVRAGPWENKSEADKTAEKIKKLNLSAAVLTL